MKVAIHRPRSSSSLPALALLAMAGEPGAQQRFEPPMAAARLEHRRSEGSSPSRVRRTVRHPLIARLQRQHFLWLTLTPAVVTVLAFGSLAARHPAHGAVAAALLLWLLTGLGVTLGYHRLFTHRAFKAARVLEGLLAILGMMAAPGPLQAWVATHRRHHSRSDAAGDPHSPHLTGPGWAGAWRGLLHAQVGWMAGHEFANPHVYARDLLRDSRWRALDRWYYPIVAAGVVLGGALAAGLERSWPAFLDGLLWAGPVRLCVVQVVISSVNSLCHCHGRRPFATHEKSTNNWLVALPTLGEGWHNNHHAFPRSAFLGLHWWEVDIGGLVLRLLACGGLVWDVRRPAPGRVRSGREVPIATGPKVVS